MKKLALCAVVLGACTAPSDDEIPATDLPPGAASKADGEVVDVVANHCELFVDRVTTSRSSHALLRVVAYLKTLNGRLDDDIAQVAYYAKVSTEIESGTCGISYACQYRDQWHAYPATSWWGSSDYWVLDFGISHDYTTPLVHEGAFYVRTKTGKTYWVNPGGGGNFFIDTNLAHDVEDALGGFSYSRGTGPAESAVTADVFTYLNPKRCR